MANIVCVGHGGLVDGEPKCKCESYEFAQNIGLYQHCACGASKNCHLSVDSNYVTGNTKKKR